MFWVARWSRPLRRTHATPTFHRHHPRRVPRSRADGYNDHGVGRDAPGRGPHEARGEASQEDDQEEGRQEERQEDQGCRPLFRHYVPQGLEVAQGHSARPRRLSGQHEPAEASHRGDRGLPQPHGADDGDRPPRLQHLRSDSGPQQWQALRTAGRRVQVTQGALDSRGNERCSPAPGGRRR